MRRRFAVRTMAAGVSAIALAVFGLGPAIAAGSPVLVAQVPVSWTPNVSADATVGQETGPACNATFFGAAQACQSEVYSAAYVNGEVIVAGAFTKVCQPGPLAKGLCTAGTQVTRDDLFAYQAGTGQIDPHFHPALNAGPAWAVVPGPPGSDSVLVGGGFSTVNGTAHRGLVALHVRPSVTTGADADGSVVTSFAGQIGGTVRRLALSPGGSALYVSGQFSSADGAATFAGGATVAGLARLNARTGALDSSFDLSLQDADAGQPLKAEAMALSPSGDELAVAGTFLAVSGQARPRLAVIATGGALGATARLTDFTAPILTNNCLRQHDYVRGLAFAPSGSYLVTADTGNASDGSTPYSVCDAVARFNLTAAAAATTGPAEPVTPSWIQYAGSDSFYAVTVSGNVVYAGGHNRWLDNFCGNDDVCEPNAVLVNGLSAMDAHTGMALPWWHPMTLRGHGVMDLATFGPGSYDGTHPGLIVGTDVDLIGGSYHSENALFPQLATTAAAPGGPVPSGLFNSEGGPSTATPLCLDDTGDATAPGGPAELETCRNDAEQNWSEQSGTLRVNGLCLGTAGGATAAGTAVVLAACQAGTTTQAWTQGTGNSLVNTGASLCLADPGSSTASGTALDLAACTGQVGQAFPLPTAQGPPAPPVTGPLFVSLKQADTQVPCLDDAGDATTAGNKVEFWTCRGDAEQDWTLAADGTIRVHGTDCLDTAGGGGVIGSAAALDPCSGRPSQVWTTGPDYELIQKSSGLCLAAPLANVTNGIRPELAACIGTLSQQWRLPAY
jgi:hypothetical protein